jgi:hypothetical protein
MASPDGAVFPQKVIAVVWDFDKTLIPGYMQAPLFKRFKVDEERFWKEVKALPVFYGQRGSELFATDTGYLSHILTYVREGVFKGLNNRMLRELGAELKFQPGLPAYFRTLKKHIEEDARFSKHEIKLEHYIVSTGLRQMILGSKIAKYVDGVWACEFLGLVAPPKFLSGADLPAEDPDQAEIRDVAYSIDNTTKTRAVFEINKGVNKHPAEITVNDNMPASDRRVPLDQMIYVADGPSDVPVFSIVNQNDGKTFAVYSPKAGAQEFKQVQGLQDIGRVMSFGPANFRSDTHTARCLTTWAEEIAERIAARFQRRLMEHIGKPPEHIVDAPAAPVDAEGARVATP